MELDKKTPLEYKINQGQEKSIEERFIIQENKLSSVLHPDLVDEAMSRFNRFITKEVRGYKDENGKPNRGPDRPKSYNPMFDALEERIVEPEVGVIYSIDQLNRMGHHMKQLGIQVQRHNRLIVLNPTPFIEEVTLPREEVGERKQNKFVTWWKAWMKQLMNK